MITDLPPPVFPTTMVVCRVSIVSYSWMTLSTCSLGSVMTLYPVHREVVLDDVVEWG